MWIYAVKRFVAYIPVYVFVMFAITWASWEHMDVVDAHLSKRASAAERAKKLEEFGLVGNVLVRNLKKTWNTVRFKFGVSLTKNERVSQVLWERSFVSLMLTLPALLLSTLLSVTIGLLAAFYRGRAVDRILMMGATAGMSVSFLVYIIVLQYLLTYQLKLFPIYGFPDSYLLWVPFLTLPVLIQVLVSMGYDSRFYRAVMVEESNADYITTAYAKGLSTRKVIFVHMLKNAMIPIITRVFISLPFLFMGSFLLEIFFGVPGLGSALINALTGKTDPPLIIGATAILCTLYILFLILTDVMYAVVDPRVRLE